MRALSQDGLKMGDSIRSALTSFLQMTVISQANKSVLPRQCSKGYTWQDIWISSASCEHHTVAAIFSSYMPAYDRTSHWMSKARLTSYVYAMNFSITKRISGNLSYTDTHQCLCPRCVPTGSILILEPTLPAG